MSESEILNEELMTLTTALTQYLRCGDELGFRVTVLHACMLTAQRADRAGKFYKEAFLGDEQLRFHEIYYGKKNTPIFVFLPGSKGADYKQVELSLDDLNKHTDFITVFKNEKYFKTFEDLGMLLNSYRMVANERVKTRVVERGSVSYGKDWGFFA